MNREEKLKKIGDLEALKTITKDKKQYQKIRWEIESLQFSLEMESARSKR